LCRAFIIDVEKFIFVVLSEDSGVPDDRIVWNGFNYKKRNIYDLEKFVEDNNLMYRFTKIK